jgi:sulfur-oxidizing protein SoxY
MIQSLPIAHFRSASRRAVLAAGGAAVLGIMVRPLPAQATIPDPTLAAIKKLTGGADLKPGRVRMEIPTLVESGSSVSVEIEAESPMSAAERCLSLHLFTEKNPLPEVISVALGPACARARIDTRIRLAASQTIHAIAKFSDGSWHKASADVIITIAACLED